MSGNKNSLEWVISNYNCDVSSLIPILKEDYFIFDQSKNPDNYLIDQPYRKTLHSGHNISDYLLYIIENYINLPERVGFIKGNIIPRHITYELMQERIKGAGFIPLYGDKETYKPKWSLIPYPRLVAQQISPGIYQEISNNWYVKHRPQGRVFTVVGELFQYLFGRDAPKYILFTPGACMMVPRDKILRWELSVYEKLYESVTYDYFPVEAFHVERMMLYLFYFEKT